VLVALDTDLVRQTLLTNPAVFAKFNAALHLSSMMEKGMLFSFGAKWKS